TVDLPVNLLEWELFLPEQYSARPTAGNVIPVRHIVPGPPPVAALSPLAATETVEVNTARDASRPSTVEQLQQVPSQNVVNMQRKVAGVLPVQVDVPRAGTSYRFIRPLVLDERTAVRFKYKRR